MCVVWYYGNAEKPNFLHESLAYRFLSEENLSENFTHQTYANFSAFRRYKFHTFDKPRHDAIFTLKHAEKCRKFFGDFSAVFRRERRFFGANGKKNDGSRRVV